MTTQNTNDDSSAVLGMMCVGIFCSVFWFLVGIGFALFFL